MLQSNGNVDCYGNNSHGQAKDYSGEDAVCDLGPHFIDVPSSYWAYDFIEAIYIAEITAGCDLGNYCPELEVTRAQMAVLIITSMGETPSAVAYNAYFDDIADDGFAPFINRMKELGITSGCGPTSYCPNTNLTRKEMAVYIIMAMGETGSAVAYNAYFSDIADDGYAPFINRMKELNITAGCGGGMYCPDATLTRAEMAVFLYLAFLAP